MVSLIDTDVMIDVSRENAGAANYLDSLSDPAVSIITAQELILIDRSYGDYAGLPTREQKSQALRDDRWLAA
jgi:predicted nucleic acid-binding protein